MGHKLETSGFLRLKFDKPVTLKELEEFCTEARSFGVGDHTVMHTTRQGIVGPMTSFGFPIPVEPKKTDA